MPTCLRNKLTLLLASVLSTLLVACALFLGLGAEAIYKVAFRAGEQLEDPKHYITAVLGDEAYANVQQELDKRQAEAASAAGEQVTVHLDAEPEEVDG